MTEGLKQRLMVVPRVVRLYARPARRRLWKTIGDEVPVWDARNELIASMIAPASRILDLGCGARTIRDHAAAPVAYVGCDLAPAGPDVEPIDLNAGRWPAGGREFDVVVMSGVLEYLRDVEAVLARVHEYAPVLLTSYQDLRPSRGRVERRAIGWLNHLTRAEIERAFLAAGWSVAARHAWNDSFVYALRDETGAVGLSE